MASIGLEKHDINAHESERLHVVVSRLPLLNDCVITKQTFCICASAYIRSNSVVFFQLWALAMKIS